MSISTVSTFLHIRASYLSTSSGENPCGGNSCYVITNLCYIRDIKNYVVVHHMLA